MRGATAMTGTDGATTDAGLTMENRASDVTKLYYVLGLGTQGQG